jgi:glycine dehydrogenase subunit 1
MGADIVVAEGQSLGNGLNFGGPYVGLFATRSNYVRQMPGRLVGETVDANGQRGFVLTLVAREQHIRRDKATSNICTNSGLCALAFTIHVSLLGEQGLRRLAQLNHAAASDMVQHLSNKKHENNKITVCNKTYFNEFLLDLGQPAEPLVERWAARGLLAGVPLSRLYPNQPELANHLLVAATELTQQSHKDEFYQAIKEVC